MDLNDSIDHDRMLAQLPEAQRRQLLKIPSVWQRLPFVRYAATGHAVLVRKRRTGALWVSLDGHTAEPLDMARAKVLISAALR